MLNNKDKEIEKLSNDVSYYNFHIQKYKSDAERALDLFYSTKTYQQLSDPRYGLQLMSDQYLLENVLEELREDTTKGISRLEHAVEYSVPKTVTGCVAEDPAGYNAGK